MSHCLKIVANHAPCRPLKCLPQNNTMHTLQCSKNGFSQRFLLTFVFGRHSTLEHYWWWINKLASSEDSIVIISEIWTTDRGRCWEMLSHLKLSPLKYISIQLQEHPIPRPPIRVARARHKNCHMAISRELRVVSQIRWCQNDWISLMHYPIIEPLRGSHGRSARRAWRTLSGKPEGPLPKKSGPGGTPRLLVFSYCIK